MTSIITHEAYSVLGLFNVLSVSMLFLVFSMGQEISEYLHTLSHRLIQYEQNAKCKNVSRKRHKRRSSSYCENLILHSKNSDLGERIQFQDKKTNEIYFKLHSPNMSGYTSGLNKFMKK